jgi:hypothetical protein
MECIQSTPRQIPKIMIEKICITNLALEIVKLECLVLLIYEVRKNPLTGSEWENIIDN